MGKVGSLPVYFAMVEDGAIFQHCLKNGGSRKWLMQQTTDWVLEQGYRPVVAVSNPENKLCKVLCIPSNPHVNDDLMLVVTIKLGEEEKIAGYKLVPGLRKNRNLYRIAV